MSLISILRIILIISFLTYYILWPVFISGQSQSLNEVEVCNNGIDDDLDGLVDCFDPDCCKQNSCFNYWYECDQAYCIDGELLGIHKADVGFGDYYLTHNAFYVADIDFDGSSEVLLLDYDRNIRILDIENFEEYSIHTRSPFGFHSIAIADVIDTIDGGEILAISPFEMWLFSQAGEIIWHDSIRHFSRIVGFADINADGKAEIYIGNNIINAQTGKELLEINVTSFSQSVGNIVPIDIFSDTFCDDCQGLELLIDARIYAVDIANSTYELLSNFDDFIGQRAVSFAIDWGLGWEHRNNQF